MDEFMRGLTTTVSVDDDNVEQCFDLNTAFIGRVRIAANKQLAKEMVNQVVADPAVFALFADGSTINGSAQLGYTTVSGAGIAYQRLSYEGQWVGEVLPLPGTDNSTTAEMQAILRALDHAMQEWKRIAAEIDYATMRVTICTDCRPALDRIVKLEDGSSLVPEEPNLQTLLEIRDKAGLLNKMDVYVDFVWVPGHYGVRGNEFADMYARRAARRALQIPPPPPEFVFG